jgi:hypothetical protein
MWYFKGDITAEYLSNEIINIFKIEAPMNVV